MSILIGNAPCSWGVEFADDPRNPTWRTVLKECAEAGYKGIELGPVGFMPEDPAELRDALAEFDLELIGGVVFRPFHDPSKWDDDVLDGIMRTCKALQAHDAKHLVLIDSISPRRAPTAGRADEAEQMGKDEWTVYRNHIAEAARIGVDHGLTVGIHAHAAGFMDFEPELERLLDEVSDDILKICFDTGHHSYAGFDPVAFMKRHIVCNLGQGDVDFPAVRQVLLDAGFDGWCTVEQDCDPSLPGTPTEDARANREYLQSIGF